MYQFPVKAIVKIVLQELDGKFQSVTYGDYKSPLIAFDDEFREIFSTHRKMVEALDSYDAIDNYLSIYRRISLADWISSL